MTKTEAALNLAFGSTDKVHMDKGTAVVLLVMFGIIVWCGYVFWDQEVHYWPTHEERQACHEKDGVILEGPAPHHCIKPEGLIF